MVKISRNKIQETKYKNQETRKQDTRAKIQETRNQEIRRKKIKWLMGFGWHSSNPCKPFSYNVHKGDNCFARLPPPLQRTRGFRVSFFCPMCNSAFHISSTFCCHQIIFAFAGFCCGDFQLIFRCAVSCFWLSAISSQLSIPLLITDGSLTGCVVKDNA